MSSILQTASGIATPIGLSAFIAGLLLIAFREVVRKGAFPKLNQALSAEIVRLVIDRLFWLGLVAMLIGGATMLAPTLTGQQSAKEIRLPAEITYGEPAHNFQLDGIQVKFYDNTPKSERYVLSLPNGSLVRNVFFEGHRYEFLDNGVRYSFRVNYFSSNRMNVTLVKNASER